jgi:hypothetical protein
MIGGLNGLSKIAGEMSLTYFNRSLLRIDRHRECIHSQEGLKGMSRNAEALGHKKSRPVQSGDVVGLASEL